MMHFRDLVLFLFFSPRGARRSIRIDDSRDDAQQVGTLANLLQESVDAQEAVIPGVFGARIVHRVGPQTAALREMTKEDDRRAGHIERHRGSLFFRSGPRRAKVALQASSPERGIQIGELQQTAESALREAHAEGSNNEIMNDLFRPAGSEISSAAADVIHGCLPSDLPRGAVLKNGPNAKYDSSGGWLDGDAMVCCVILPPDGATPRFSRTYLRTAGFSKEEAAGKRLFEGTLVAPRGLKLLQAIVSNVVRAAQPQKDTANTAFLPLAGGRVLALMEQCLPCEFRVARNGTVTTTQPQQDFGGRLLNPSRFPFSGGATTAHFKTDPTTREALGVAYCSFGPPAASIDRFDAQGNPASPVIVPLAGDASCMIHDAAITRGYVFILDFPMTLRPSRMVFDKFPVAYEPEAGARIGLVRRNSEDGSVPAEAEVVWTPVEPCVVLHTVNAHENSDGTVTLTALRSLPSTTSSFIESYTTAFLYRWVVDPRSATCIAEEALSSVPLEFPTLDPRLLGSDARFGFAIRPCSIGGPNRYGPPFEGILINAIVKYDLRTGNIVGEWTAPQDWFVVSEPTFVPKTGSDAGDGDRGYLLVYATRSFQGRRSSRLYVLDAEALSGVQRGDDSDPVAAVISLPGSVPYGLHSAFVPYEDLE